MWVERAQTLNVRLCACVYVRVCVYVDLPCPSTAVFLSLLMQRTGALKMLVFLLWNLNVYQTLDTRGHIRTQLYMRVKVSPCSKFSLSVKRLRHMQNILVNTPAPESKIRKSVSCLWVEYEAGVNM